MWTRSRLHECADELKDVCQQFRDAYWSRGRSRSWPMHPDDIKTMKETSIKGVKILRYLALSIRSEQDYNELSNPNVFIGMRKEQNMPYSSNDLNEIKHNGGFTGYLGSSLFKKLSLRQTLNVIAHANPNLSDFYVRGDYIHDLILTGNNKEKNWLAIISLIHLIEEIYKIEDRNIAEM